MYNTKNVMKLFAKKCLAIFIMVTMCLSLDLTFALAEDSSSGRPIRETDVTQAGSGCLLAEYDGLFTTEPSDKILERLNEIRLEACNEGIAGLTPEQYVPLTWSSHLEWIAQTRAAEGTLRMGHTRPNGATCSSTYYKGVTSDAENLAWNYTWISDSVSSVDLLGGIEQWYEEKDDLLNNTGGETGHYLIMIDPSVRSVGIGAFKSNSTEHGCVAGEFSRSQLKSQEQIGVDGEYSQIIEIEGSSLNTKDSSDTTLLHTGKSMNLNAQFTSSYFDETCPYVQNEVVTGDVTPIDLVWKSEDTSIAEVDSNGVATGIAPGNTNITASYGTVSYKFFVNVKQYDPRDYNTDTDVGDVDGEYTFTGDGDWYGWRSYCNYDPPAGHTISGRTYIVTIPEDGRLELKITADEGTFMDAEIRAHDGDSYENYWEIGEAGSAVDFFETTDVLKAGKYVVSMGLDLMMHPEYGFSYPGLKFFDHLLTFRALTEDEAAEFTAQKEAAAVEDMVGKLPEVDSLTLEDAAQVQAAADALEALSEEAKAKVSDESKAEIAAAVERIKELRQQASEEEANKAAAQGAENLISSLPDASALTLDNEQAVNDALAAYNVLTDKQKSYVSSDAVDKLFEAVGKINELKDAQGQGGSGSGEGGSESGEGGSGTGESGSGSGSTSGTTPSASTSKVSAPAEIMDLPAVKIAKPKAAKKAVTVKWKKVSKKNKKKIAGIEIQVATDRGFTNIVKTANGKKTKTSAKVKKLKSKKTYYVRVRAYKNISGVKHVSKWSSVKKVKVK